MAENYVRQYMRRQHVKIKAPEIAIFIKNLKWVMEGLRPALICEQLVLNDNAFVELLQNVTHFISNRSCNNLCVLNIADDRFIVNTNVCKNHLKLISQAIYREDIKQPIRHGTPIFIDISKKLSQPSVACSKSLEQIAFACDTMVQILQQESDSSNMNMYAVSLDSTVNLCTLFGCVLGYPVIYYFTVDENEENCLSMVPLTVVKFIGENDKSRKPLVSFSYPTSLHAEVFDSVKHWCNPISEQDESVAIEKLSVEMPFVVL